MLFVLFHVILGKITDLKKFHVILFHVISRAVSHTVGSGELCAAAVLQKVVQGRRRGAVSRVESLYGTSPAEIFQSGIENLDEIDAVAVSVMWKDGRA